MAAKKVKSTSARVRVTLPGVPVDTTGNQEREAEIHHLKNLMEKQATTHKKERDELIQLRELYNGTLQDLAQAQTKLDKLESKTVRMKHVLMLDGLKYAPIGDGLTGTPFIRAETISLYELAMEIPDAEIRDKACKVIGEAGMKGDVATLDKCATRVVELLKGKS